MNLLSTAATGTTGSIGTFLPKEVFPLETRLGSETDFMVQELLAFPEIPKRLIHLAALTSLSDCLENPDAARSANVDGALKWYEAAARAGVQRFVFVSTSHVYQKTEPGVKIDVDHPTEPKSFYGELKLEAEMKLREASKDQPKCQLIIARVFSVLSPLMRPGFLLTGLTERARNKDFSPIPGLDNIRDFLTADEVAQKLIRLCLSEKAPPIANICSGKGQTVRSIAEQVFMDHGLDPKQLEVDKEKSGGDPFIVGRPTPF